MKFLFIVSSFLLLCGADLKQVLEEHVIPDNLESFKLVLPKLKIEDVFDFTESVMKNKADNIGAYLITAKVLTDEVKFKCSKCNALLFLAIRNELKKCKEALLRKRLYSLDSLDENQENLLHGLVRLDDIKSIKVILTNGLRSDSAEAGKIINHQNKDGYTPFALTAIKGNQEIADLLHGANAEANLGSSPVKLHLERKPFNLLYLKFLKRSGCEFDEDDRDKVDTQFGEEALIDGDDDLKRKDVCVIQ